MSLENYKNKIQKEEEKLQKKLEKELKKIEEKENKKRLKKEKRKNFKNKLFSVFMRNKEYKKDRKIFQKDDFRTIAKIKRKNRFIIFLVWFLIISILSTSIFLIFTKGVDKIKLSNNTTKLEQLENKFNSTNIYNSKMDNFAKNFTTLYINYTEDKEKERKSNLDNYYLKGLKDNVTFSEKTSRNLSSIRLYSTEKIDDNNYIYKYIINYTISKEDTKKTIQEMINISIKLQNESYSISNYPYYSTIPKDISIGDYKEKEINLDKEKEKREDLENFTKDFFKKYTTYKLDEIKYLMNNPEIISGKELQDLPIIDVYKDNDKYIIYTEVNLKEKELKIVTTEKFTLTVVVKDGKYFVEKLEHN